MSITIHIMTAALSQGDAIGNYILSLNGMLRDWGVRVELYADFPNPAYPLQHQHSSQYHPTGNDILWFHYSIYSDNVHWITRSPDFVILDSHGICPPHLFAGYDEQMEELCRKGEQFLPALAQHSDLAIAHTRFVADGLRGMGFRTIRTLPLVVDTARFTGVGDPAWEPLLSKLDYLLFVGRVVPQKNLGRSLDLFAALLRRRPGIKYIIVGGRHLPRYAEELEIQAARLGIGEDVVFSGPISEPHTLTSFFRHARFYLCLSEWESFCVPLAESLHFGTPVLGWEVPPIPETMGPGGVVLKGDNEAMAAQIDALWEDPARYRQLQARGQAHVATFTDSGLRAGVLKLLREIAEG
ncbi:MAG: glycosyltransferase family 4 protein [Oscillochloris sp.]|nr:glycosyltransferase family 4 protein [Oscillochloris sp.]